jgi:hypothetical protein
MNNELTEKHSLINDTKFRLKILVLTVLRAFKNVTSSIRKYSDMGLLNQESVIAFSESDLWNPFDNKDNWILTAGKIQNLRIAAKNINGTEIKADEVFSFWKHIGNPNIGKGYVIGREIREGCIVPTIAGGLCQLSNAIYDAALNANFEIVERHKHTKVIKGSLAEQDRDATVKWNYIDLRFKSKFDFRIEVELTSEKLIVRFRSEQKNVKTEKDNSKIQDSNKLNDCYSCGNFACFKHPDRTSIQQNIASITFVLDERWPEYDQYIQEIATSSDTFILPLKRNKLLNTTRYSWTTSMSKNVQYTNVQGIYRALVLRFKSKKQNNVFEQSLQLDKKIAFAAARKIPVESTHLVISQNLLPFLYESGVLGGRTFDVLMTRLPFEKLHERLDAAFSKHHGSATLRDFRANEKLVTLENKALTLARNIITPHSEIKELFRNKVVHLAWHIPSSNNKIGKGGKVLFPASAVGRKGAYEMKRLAMELNFKFAFTGRVIESDNFWEALEVEKFDGDLSSIGLIVYPAHTENQPRQLLKAISLGIPIIATSACGIESSENVSIIDIGNFDQLKNEFLSHRRTKVVPIAK